MAVTIDYELDEWSYDAYWDGYYDGYYDDAYGFDTWEARWSDRYRSAYSDGYADGYYDNVTGLTYLPTYYVFSWAMPDEETDERRAADQTRRRGDRASVRHGGGGGEGMRGPAADRARRDIEERLERDRRVRGEVTSMSRESGEAGGHLILVIVFEDDRSVRADLGPRMTMERLPIEPGQRVTIIGSPLSTDPEGKSEQDADAESAAETLRVRTLIADGRTFRLRGPGRDGGSSRGSSGSTGSSGPASHGSGG